MIKTLTCGFAVEAGSVRGVVILRSHRIWPGQAAGSGFSRLHDQIRLRGIASAPGRTQLIRKPVDGGSQWVVIAVGALPDTTDR